MIDQFEPGDQFVKTITDAMPGLIAYWDADLKCRFANRGFLESFSCDLDEVIGKSIQEVFGECLYCQNEPCIQEVLSGKPVNFERTIAKADGSIGYSWANYVPHFGPDRTVAGFFVLLNDVTQLKVNDLALKLASGVFANVLEGIMVTDGDGIILSVNPAFTATTGYSAEESIGRTPQILKSYLHESEFYSALWKELLETGRWEGEIWNRHRDGRSFLQHETIAAVHGGQDEPLRYVAVFRDVTERWRGDERLRHLALHDPLTDLANRHLLAERLSQLIGQSTRTPRRSAVIYCDLDGFKAINDAHGHAMGDFVLVAVARRLRSQVRATDTVARVGGDEFVILLDNPAEGEAEQVAARVVASAGEAMDIRGERLVVGISVGVAEYPLDGRTPDALIGSADAAMYAAKAAGKNGYRVFNPRRAL